MLGAGVTAAIGIHAIFGAFLVGVIMPRAEGHAERLVDRLESMTTTVFLPMFFVIAGLSVRLEDLQAWPAVAITALIVVVATVGKLLGAVIAVRIGDLSRVDAFGLGVLLNTRGLTEIVVLAIGLEVGAINNAVYSAMVVMALVTTCAAAPLLERTGIAGRWRRGSTVE